MPDNSIVQGGSAITPQIIQEEGAGKAYQSVAQSTALAIQDATDNLRNINTISTTAMGVAIAQALAVPELASQYGEIITMATTMSTAATANFAAIGTSAAAVLNGYPNGS